MSLNPEANPKCKTCNGCGLISISSICTGFGGGLGESVECMCVLYKKLDIPIEEDK